MTWGSLDPMCHLRVKIDLPLSNDYLCSSSAHGYCKLRLQGQVVWLWNTIEVFLLVKVLISVYNVIIKIKTVKYYVICNIICKINICIYNQSQRRYLDHSAGSTNHDNIDAWREEVPEILNMYLYSLCSRTYPISYNYEKQADEQICSMMRWDIIQNLPVPS